MKKREKLLEGNKEIQEVLAKRNESKQKLKLTKTKKETCKILWIDKNKIGFNFIGYGVSYKVDNFEKNEFVEVEYIGKIGSKNFKIINVK